MIRRQVTAVSHGRDTEQDQAMIRAFLDIADEAGVSDLHHGVNSHRALVPGEMVVEFYGGRLLVAIGETPDEGMHRRAVAEHCNQVVMLPSARAWLVGQLGAAAGSGARTSTDVRALVHVCPTQPFLLPPYEDEDPTVWIQSVGVEVEALTGAVFKITGYGVLARKKDGAPGRRPRTVRLSWRDMPEEVQDQVQAEYRQSIGLAALTLSPRD